MKKQIAALSLSLALLAGLCSCTVEKPGLESVSEQTKSSGGTPVKESEKKKLTVSDSKIKGDLAERFHVNADVIDGGKTNLPTYYLSKINLSEDQFAEKLMSEPGYSRDDIDGQTVAFENGKEKLVVDLEGKHANPDSPSPNITYSLDKGKEYEAAVKNHSPGDKLDSAAAKTAVAAVKAMLDKLPIEYDDDLIAGKVSYTDLNFFYSSVIEYQNRDSLDNVEDPIYTDSSASLPTDRIFLYRIDDEARKAALMQEQILLYSEGKDAKLDPDFKFTKDDDCFLIKGKMKINDIPVSGTFFDPYSITAAVSSRGVEYLYIENLFISDNNSSDSPVITAGQAVDAVFKLYEVLPDKENYDIYINDISLTYTRENKRSDVSKASLRPVWIVGMDISEYREGYITVSEAQVYADSGEIMESFFREKSDRIYFAPTSSDSRKEK